MPLHSRGDDRAAWLCSGQSLQRVLLTATVRGLATQPMTQSLEVPEFRRLLADPSGTFGTPSRCLSTLPGPPPCRLA